MLVAVEEWWDSDDHLIDQDAECPPIYGIVMAIANKHLWSQILRSTAEGICKLLVCNSFCEAKICNE